MFRKSFNSQDSARVGDESTGGYPLSARRSIDLTPSPPPAHDSADLERPRSSGSSSSTSSSRRGSGSIYSQSGRDSLTAARTKLNAAIAAERAADEALINSRSAVKDAIEEINKVEVEAKEEARLAQAKMDSASKLREEGNKLGKH